MAPAPYAEFGGSMRVYGRTWICLLGLLWIAEHAAIAEDPSAWPEFTSSKAGFSIRLPTAPTEQVDPSTGATSFQVSDKKGIFVISVQHLPQEFLAMPPQEILGVICSGFPRYLSGSRLVKSENISFGGFPATICVFEAQKTGHFDTKLKMMAVLASPRVFNVGFMSRTDVFVESEVDKYLATLKIK